MLGGVANIRGDAQTGEATQGRAVGQVGARNGVAQVVQDFGNAGHARAANADKVDVLDGVFHAAFPFAKTSQAWTKLSVAVNFWSFLASSPCRTSAGRSIFCSISANFAGVSSDCGTNTPAPASARKRALVVW
jgi:hypothetical protein